MIHYKEVIEWLFDHDYEEAYKFALWCFGEGFEDVNRDELPERWNKIHGAYYEIKKSGNYIGDCLRMKELYLKIIDKK